MAIQVNIFDLKGDWDREIHCHYTYLSFLLKVYPPFYTKQREGSFYQVSRFAELHRKLLTFCFADDSIIFSRATMEDCAAILEILRLYEGASGQKINFEKSI